MRWYNIIFPRFSGILHTCSLNARVGKLSPFVLFCLIPIIIHFPILTTDADFFSGDASDLIPFIFGTKLLQYNTFQELLEIPFWNPHLFLGQPTVGNIQYTLFYPLNVLFLIFRFFTALVVCQALHMAIAGIGAYLLARHLGCGKTGGILSGMLFMLNGRLIYYIHAGWTGYFCSICWIPLLILSSISVIEKPERHRMVLFGSIFALTLLAGTPQYAFFGGALFLIHGGFAFLTAARRTARFRLLYGMLVSGLIGILLTGVQLLPSAEQTYLSTRVLFDSTSGGFHFSWDPQQWFRLLFRPEILKQDFSWEICAYIGVGGMILAIFGAAARRISLPIFIIWGGIPLLASMGPAFPPVESLLNITPGLSMLSNPSRYFIFTIAVICISAGFGFEALVHSIKAKEKIVFIIIAVFCLLILAYWIPIAGSDSTVLNLRLFIAVCVFGLLSMLWIHFRKPWLKLLLVCWLISDPVLLISEILTPYNFKDIKPPQKILQAMENHSGHTRMAVLQPRRLWGTRKTPIDDWWFIDNGISRVGGYDPLAMRDTLVFLTRLEGSSPVLQSSMWAFRLWAFGNPALFNFTGITHIVALEPMSTPHLEFVMKDSTTMPDFQGGWWQDTPLYLYKNPAALPRAFILGNQPMSAGYRLNYKRVSPNTMLLDIETPAPGRVIITESFHPGWHARTKTGEVIEVGSYLDAFISFNLSAGFHQIQLDFLPESYRQGMRLTQMGLLLSLFMLFLQQRRTA
jgi:hypothetical protein